MQFNQIMIEIWTKQILVEINQELVDIYNVSVLSNVQF